LRALFVDQRATNRLSGPAIANLRLKRNTAAMCRWALLGLVSAPLSEGEVVRPNTVDTAELEEMILGYSSLNGALELLPQSPASMAIRGQSLTNRTTNQFRRDSP
jgi:hypothetical protein